MKGFIALHRQLIHWEWYHDAETLQLFIHLLLKANHKERNYKGKLVKRGCLLTSRKLLASELGTTERKIRTHLNRLKSTNEIEVFSNRQGTEIKLVKYDEFQKGNNEATNDRPTSDQRPTTNNNDNTVNNDNNIYYYNKGNLKLTESEYQKLLKSYDQATIDLYISKVESWNKSHTIKSLYLTIINWIKRAEQSNQVIEPEKPKVINMGFNEHF